MSNEEARRNCLEMHKKDSDFQVEIKLDAKLPKSWFVRELYQDWGTVSGHKFYRYPAGGWTCQLESSFNCESAIGRGETVTEALYSAIKVAEESDRLKGRTR